VARTGRAAPGRALFWTGPGISTSWRCQSTVEAQALALAQETRTWAVLEREPAIVVRPCGRGLVATIAFHPSAARDADGAATALLRKLLVLGTRSPVAWLDLERTVVLRMDDPGSAEAAYHRAWAHPRLDAEGWAALGNELGRRDGRLSVGYSTGWVDDGDTAAGVLEIDGRPARRVPGSVRPSVSVRYTDRAGVAPGRVHDLAAQAKAIEALRRRGVAEVELHGFTHMHPDRVRWSRASDRTSNVAWYRELGSSLPGIDPLRSALERFAVDWRARPTTVIPPGDEWSMETMNRALDLRLDLFDSYYLAIRNSEQWWWSQHVCSPYLDLAGDSWFTAGLPVVGYFHERDVALEGPAWFSERLDEWVAAGARRFIDFRELAVALACRPTIDLDHGTLNLDLGCPLDVVPVRSVPVKVCTAATEATVELCGEPSQGQVLA
jgi:hypothetical protein